MNGSKDFESSKRGETRYKIRKNERKNVAALSPLVRKPSPLYPKIYGGSLAVAGTKKSRLSVPWNARRLTE